MVGGESGFVVELCFDRRFRTKRFTREGRFVDGELYRFEQLGIGRNVVTRADHHDVAHHNITLGHFDRVAFANHTHRLFIVYLIENLKFLIGFEFKVEGQTCGKQNCHKNTDRFEENRGGTVHRKKLVARDEQREYACNEQYNNNRILKFLEETLPKRHFGRRGQDIHAVPRTTFLHLTCRKAGVVIGLRHCYNDLIVISQVSVVAVLHFRQHADDRANIRLKQHTATGNTTKTTRTFLFET